MGIFVFGAIQRILNLHYLYHVKLKAIVALFLSLFVLVGSVGVAIFVHRCKEDGVFRSFFVKQAMHCELKKVTELPPCCSKKIQKSDLEKADSDCCDEHTDVFKVKFESKNDYSLHLEKDCPGTTIENHSIAFSTGHTVESLMDSWITRPPPRPSGKKLRILHQNFRI